LRALNMHTYGLNPCTPNSTLFPYPTLFRSEVLDEGVELGALDAHALVDGLHVSARVLARPAGGGADLVDELLLQVLQVRERKPRSEEHTSELQSRSDIVCRLLLEKKYKNIE